jgi:hypothetical protein
MCSRIDPPTGTAGAQPARTLGVSHRRRRVPATARPDCGSGYPGDAPAPRSRRGRPRTRCAPADSRCAAALPARPSPPGQRAATMLSFHILGSGTNRHHAGQVAAGDKRSGRIEPTSVPEVVSPNVFQKHRTATSPTRPGRGRPSARPAARPDQNRTRRRAASPGGYGTASWNRSCGRGPAPRTAGMRPGVAQRITSMRCVPTTDSSRSASSDGEPGAAV